MMRDKGQHEMAESGQHGISGDLAQHEKTWAAFRTLLKWSMIAAAMGAFLAGYLAVVWHP